MTTQEAVERGATHFRQVCVNVFCQDGIKYNWNFVQFENEEMVLDSVNIQERVIQGNMRHGQEKVIIILPVTSTVEIIFRSKEPIKDF